LAAEPARLLELTNVSLSYGSVHVVRDLDLIIDGNASLAILGANGAGKTTLLRGISGIMVRRHGSIRLGGREISGFAAHDIVRLGISQVPEGKHLFGPLTVQENIEIGALPLYQSARSAEAQRCRDMVYDLFPILKSRGGQIARTLSGGEQQMLAIARALMSAPKVLLLDEPSVGLAPKINEALFAALKRLKALGIIVVVAEQVIPLACDLADEAVVMQRGRIALKGSSTAVRGNPELKRVYLGAP
jgi:branched-chain amino acid transport system ATP-binding protein